MTDLTHIEEMKAEPIKCAYCGKPIHQEDDWWLDEDGDLTCWDNDNPENLGPHQPEKADE